MAVNASWLRMFLEMRRRHGFASGSVLALGVQDVMLSHAAAHALIQERKVSARDIPEPERHYQLSRNQRQFTSDPGHYMTIKDLARCLGYASLETLDAFKNDGPDLLWDLSRPIPKEWHNRYDLLFDIGVLEHTSDIFQALENAGNFVKPGGWIILFLPMVSPINTCLYHPNPPFYFDNLVGNGFHNFDAWINWMPDWDQHSDIRTIWLNYKYNDDVYIWRPRYYTLMFFMAQKLEHRGQFEPVLQNFYQEWHGGGQLFATKQDQLSGQAVPADEGPVRTRPIRQSGFFQSLLASFGGTTPVRNAEAKEALWRWPTAGNQLSQAQRARFPEGEFGVPHASQYLVLRPDSRTLPEVPEQMLAGSPPREQLYL